MADDLRQLAGAMNLETLEIRHVDHMLHRLGGASRTVFVLLSGIVPGFKDTVQLIARKPEGWKPVPPANAVQMANG